MLNVNNLKLEVWNICENNRIGMLVKDLIVNIGIFIIYMYINVYIMFFYIIVRFDIK